MRGRTPPRRFERLGFLAAAALVLGPALAWLRLVPAMVGFGLFAVGGLLGVVMALTAIVRAVRGRGFGSAGLAAIVAGVVFVATATRGRGLPAINDFTTDLGDPPAFARVADLPENAGRDLAYPPAFAAVQRGCCPDLRPARLRLGPEEAFARAQAVAERMPAWRVIGSDRGAGTIEAVATTRLFGFQDDVVIRLRPDGDGTTRVDVRSKSRDGRGDLGANAARIRAYVAALESTSPP